MARPAPTTCPCGLPQPYESCCGRYHCGTAAAPTAEALMRSRYCAFTRRDAAYLLRTWHPDTRPPGIDFADAPRWTGLEIVETADGSAFHQHGTVTFRAHFEGGVLHERSRFARLDGAWVYVDGDFIE
ncbi:YchJ family metal-binding protein [Streptomyces sp. NPDC050095]|uniref:YchJ family protein n=1 Tax=unclassified Streptomyces TaxID=2593676 RepID=UPI00342B7F7B